MAPMRPTSNAHEQTPGHSQLGGTYAPEARGPRSQGTNAVRGPWGSAGDAGRPRRTRAGQTGNTPVGPGPPRPGPIRRRLDRLATQAQHSPEMACTTLAPHLDVARLERAFRRLTPHSAPGVDRVTWRMSKEPLETNLEPLHEKLVNDTYGPHAVVRRRIPQSQGKLRPLGLPALEDKSGAKAVALLLEAIYEQDFYDRAQGFRPGRSPPQALHEGRQGLLGSRMRDGIDWDSSAFFDT